MRWTKIISIEENIKELETRGIFPFYAPEFDSCTGSFLGFTSHLQCFVGYEYIGNTFKTRTEALKEAVSEGNKILKERTENKTLTLFG